MTTPARRDGKRDGHLMAGTEDAMDTTDGMRRARRDAVLSERLVLLICGVVFTLTFGCALYVLFGLHDTAIGWLSRSLPAPGTWQSATFHAIGLGFALWGLVSTWRTSKGWMRVMYIASELAALWLLFPELPSLGRHVTFG